MKKYHTITFLPENKTIQVEDRRTIFETIELDNQHGIELRFACGAEGICQKCKIRAFQKMGPLTPTEIGCLSDEELARGIRLSCQARVIQDTQVEIIYKQPFSIKIVDEHPAVAFDLSPRVKKIYIQAEAGLLSEEKFMHELLDSISRDAPPGTISEIVQQEIIDIFNNQASGCTAVVIDGEVVTIEEGDTTHELFAAAIDLGINTLMLSLIDLSSGKSIAVVSDTNPQHHVEADLETRISLSCEDPIHLEILSEEVLLRIDVLLHELCQAKNISPLHIYDITMSGATGMLRLFLKGVPGVLEQRALFDRGGSVVFSAKHASITSSPSARISTLPIISSYVGADITAGIIATQLHRSLDTVLFLDLGTMGKAALYHNGTITAASTGEGAAFECVGIRFGMRPEAGAIERVTAAGDIQAAVIGESLPRGICGSGLIELAGELVNAGIINEHGDIQDAHELCGVSSEIIQRLIVSEEEKSFLLYRDEGEFASDIYVTQDDIHALMRSKAYLSATVKLLLQKAGTSYSEVKRVLIGGAFGYHVDPEAFIRIGLIPETLRGYVFFVGNTSKAGAHLALLDRTILEEAEQIARDVHSFDPVHDPRFERLVQESLNFRGL
ncbi:MAG: ASKHA domain-containing protein [Proteobacteria bacterium]|nr:ASKHA domain-containing protein [Pseudomonadota bacterium]